MLFTPGREFPPKDHTTPIVSTGEAANPVSSYVVTYGEIRYVFGLAVVLGNSAWNLLCVHVYYVYFCMLVFHCVPLDGLVLCYSLLCTDLSCATVCYVVELI